MKVLFLTIALSLFSFLQAQQSLSEEIEGTYFIKAIVTHGEFFGEPFKDMSPLTITSLDNGDLEAKFTINKTIHMQSVFQQDGECIEIKLKFEKTNEPGVFSLDDSNYLLHIEETSVKGHWIFFSEWQFHGNQVRTAQLLAPNREENLEAFEDYKKFVNRHGFSKEKISIPREVAACTPDHV